MTVKARSIIRPAIRPAIRPIVISDTAAIVDLETSLFSSALNAQQLTHLLQHQTFFGLVLEIAPKIAPKIVGYVLATHIIDQAEIISFGISPDHQGCGLGDKLLTRCLHDLTAANAHDTVLEVAADNVPALQLYRRHGFQIIGTRPQYYKRPSGSADAVMMKCNL